ncbi:peroxisome membrane protein [Dacryopinax primogenitus]|uniref:Peroxisomal membrane protein PEX16 n=1 Tax=Dacryopinax primogenitus (strain DJM 731) TaxID=1858805 RepID=M5FQI9_DACPD|nr:peroxisome membrane protein [Dacryopinax primogenitus]EJT97753.1 peroxisome membrane protein [Dacryopinax primogenitus]
MSSPVAAYESFLVAHLSAISTIESSLRSLTWFLPGRFKDAELASESLATTLNMVSLYHDTLLTSLVKDKKPVIPPTPHMRYTRAWCDKSAIYKWAARTLEAIRHCELFMEMLLRRRFGKRGAWRGVVGLEFLKATLRLILFRVTSRPVVSPPLPERDLQMPEELDNVKPALPASIPETPAHLQNNRVPTVKLPVTPAQAADINGYLLPKALKVTAVREARQLVPKVSGTAALSEIVFILRPLIYVLSLTYSKSSSLPYLVSLVLDFLARRLRPPTLPFSASSEILVNEYSRRDRQLALYLFKGPVWRDFTRPRLEGFASRTENIPLVNVISALVRDWVPLIDEYYYYTAT